MAGREAQQAHGRAWDWRVRCVADTDDAWRRVERMLMRQKLQSVRGGACDAVSGRSWFGFA